MVNITHILVASDLTERSRPALHRALQLKQQLAAEMTLLHVVEPGLPAAVTERRRQEALSVLREEINAAYQGELRRFSLDILVGERLGTIIEQAGTRGADLIILGDTTKRRWKDLFIGTTTERVVRHSRQPVLVVSRPGKRALQARVGGMGLVTGRPLGPRGGAFDRLSSRMPNRSCLAGAFTSRVRWQNSRGDGPSPKRETT